MIVGKFYMVPCVQTAKNGNWPEYVSILGPKHTDAEYINFPHEHWHVDWRFVPRPYYGAACTRNRYGSPLARVLLCDEAIGKPEMRRMEYLRDMPDFPSMRTAMRTNWAQLERAQAIRCNKLKPGNICPHRGIDLTPFIKEDGTVICPGHGLKWDTKTGEMLPHHAT